MADLFAQISKLFGDHKDAFGPASTTCGIFLAVLTLAMNLKRSRREMATNLLYNWAKELDPVTNRALLVATSMPEAILVDIFERKSVAVSGEYYDAIETILSKGFIGRLPDKSEGPNWKFRHSAEHSNFVRFQVVSWLNRLEAIVTAWQIGAADQAAMGQVFGRLIFNYCCELKKLSKIEGMTSDVPVLFDFHKQLHDNGYIAVPRALSLWPFGNVEWPPRKWRAAMASTRKEMCERKTCFDRLATLLTAQTEDA